jgi:hypothetical protein
MPRFSNRPFLAMTISFLSSRGQPRDLQCAIRVPRPLPAHNLHPSSPNPHGSTNLPFVIPRFQERSAELQIPRLPRISCRECGFGQLHVVLFKENHISGRW